MTIRKILASLALGAVLVTGSAVTAPQDASAATSRYAVVKAPACKHEDSKKACYWDAKKRGNKKGTSFYVMPKGSKGVYFRHGKRVTVKLPKGAVVFDVKKSKKDGYVRKSTVNKKAWVIVCPKKGGWILEDLNGWQFACN